MRISEASYDTSGLFPNILTGKSLGVEYDRDVKSQHLRLIDHYKPYLQSQSQTGLSALMHYTSAGSRPINRMLTTGFDHTNRPTEDIIGYENRTRGFHNELQQIFKDAPPAPEDIHVFSGMHQHKISHVSQHQFGSDVEFKAYTSTSLHMPISMNFVTGTVKNKLRSRHVAQLEVPKGNQNGLYIDGLSANRGEKEFLLNAGTKATYKGITEHTAEIPADPNSRWDEGMTEKLYVHRFVLLK